MKSFVLFVGTGEEYMAEKAMTITTLDENGLVWAERETIVFLPHTYPIISLEQTPNSLMERKYPVVGC